MVEILNRFLFQLFHKESQIFFLEAQAFFIFTRFIQETVARHWNAACKGQLLSPALEKQIHSLCSGSAVTLIGVQQEEIRLLCGKDQFI